MVNKDAAMCNTAALQDFNQDHVRAFSDDHFQSTLSVNTTNN